jgi:thiol-disulfide isomerase/thioredoxin
MHARKLETALVFASLVHVFFGGVANAQSVEPNLDNGQETFFPNDWYVPADGIEELRNLEGKPATEIAVAEWRGDKTTLADLKGKIVVLDFWATWCGPCMAAIPKNVEFVEKYKDKGVVLIGLHDAKSGWDSVDKVIADKGINYPVALDNTKDGNGETTKSYALKFWPTYFLIDRDGIVRAAGIKPNKIEEAVVQLMAGSSSQTSRNAIAKSDPFSEKWYLGGDKRMTSSKAVEGKPAAELALGGWIGSAVDDDSWNQRVRVIQFVRPELAASVDQLVKLQAVAGRFASQGVFFMAVCDSRASEDRLKTMIEEKRIEIPIAMDRKLDNEQEGIGVTGNSMGIKFSPATIVIDRAGVLRAAGLKPDFLDKVLNQLLAESVPILDEVVVRPGTTDAKTTDAKTTDAKQADAKQAEGEKKSEAKPESDR